MCGRYSLGKTDRLDWQKFGVKAIPTLTPRWNVAPGTDVLVIRDVRKTGREASTSIKWGLVPYWAKDPAIGHKQVNARAESAHERPAFREPFATRRCLIPADGFFEWEGKSGQKGRQPWYAAPTDGTILALGGLWDSWRTPEGGRLETCVILTVPANAQMAPIHDRMPVIIPPARWDEWISEHTLPARARELCATAAEGELDVWRVGFGVNSAEKDGPEIVSASGRAGHSP